MLSWPWIGLLIALSAVLGVLQYRWISQVSRAESDRLHASLHANLEAVARDFNAELTDACASLLPNRIARTDEERDREFVSSFGHWRESNPRASMFRSIWMFAPTDGKWTFRKLDTVNGGFVEAEWPNDWERVRERLAGRVTAVDGFPGPVTGDVPSLLDLPYFGPPAVGHAWREVAWLLAEVDLDYVRETWLPQLLQRRLDGSATAGYDAQIAMAANPSATVLATKDSKVTASNADGSIRLFEPRMETIHRRVKTFGEPDGPYARPPAPMNDSPPTDRGRWRLFVRYRNGSLDALVAQTRMRNLAVTGGILLLMMAAVAALVRFTRRAQRLAELQIQFVAGVSHELRTPLTVMRTAGHNLRGKVAYNPERVQRYGALIQEESEKLSDIVEQVLQFANIRAGRVIGAREPVSVEALIDDAIKADRRLLDESQCLVEKKIGDALPPVLGDRTSLKHALQNIIGNAAKYGKGGDWIGISAMLAHDGSMVDIRVADHGPGISATEIEQIFDPFFRGKKAVADQVHGTGLGLSLAKRIIEAHNGAIDVHSEEGKGTEFLVRIPVADGNASE